MLDTSPTAVKGTLQRARAALARTAAGGSHAPAGGRGSAAERDLASRFAAAFTAGDVDSVVSLLTDDVWLALPPAPHEYVGREAVTGFLRASTAWRARQGTRFRLLPIRANGQPAFACYLSRRTREATAYVELPTASFTDLLVLTICGDRISGITQLSRSLPHYAPPATTCTVGPFSASPVEVGAPTGGGMMHISARHRAVERLPAEGDD